MTKPEGHPLQLLIRKLETHHPLLEDDRQAVLDLPFKIRTMESNSYLLREGDQPKRCAVLLSGFAYRHKITGDGARQILALHIPGEALDFQNLFLGQADHNLQMLSRGDVADIPMEAVEALALARPGVGQAILVNTLVEASIFREWALNVGRRDSRSRIAHLLCEFAVRLSVQGVADGDYFELPMTQEQLADTTGLTPVHVNRVLKALQAAGLIERNRRAIRFPDWKHLRDVGDFNTRYLHLREGQPAAFQF